MVGSTWLHSKEILKSVRHTALLAISTEQVQDSPGLPNRSRKNKHWKNNLLRGCPLKGTTSKHSIPSPAPGFFAVGWTSDKPPHWSIQQERG